MVSIDAMPVCSVVPTLLRVRTDVMAVKVMQPKARSGDKTPFSMTGVNVNEK